MKSKWFYFVQALVSILIIVSCDQNGNRLNIDVRNIDINEVIVKRYGKTLFEIDKDHFKEELLKIQPEYNLFLAGDLNDSLNLYRLQEFVNDPFLIHTSDQL